MFSLYHRTIILPTSTLLWREVIRFYRQRGRIIGALLTPIIFWVLIGTGMGQSFQLAESKLQGGYLEYFIPGIMVMILLFTAIFSMISLIEDRREGFLQAVLVAPISRFTVILGKVMGATLISVVQALLFALLVSFTKTSLELKDFFFLTISFTIISLALALLGFVMAWNARSIQGFHVLMNLLLLPMWLLSGAVFPMIGAPLWMKWIMKVNPLTYAVSAVRNALYSSRLNLGEFEPSWMICMVVLFGLAILLFLWGWREVQRPRISAVP